MKNIFLAESIRVFDIFLNVWEVVRCNLLGSMGSMLPVKMKYLKNTKSEAVLTIEPDQSLAHPHPTLHNTIAFVITLGQFFGVMPLYGMTKKEVHYIKFKWRSLRFLYSVYNFAGALITALFCCIRFAIHGVMLDKTGMKSFLFEWSK